MIDKTKTVEAVEKAIEDYKRKTKFQYSITNALSEDEIDLQQMIADNVSLVAINAILAMYDTEDERQSDDFMRNIVVDALDY